MRGHPQILTCESLPVQVRTLPAFLDPQNRILLPGAGVRGPSPSYLTKKSKMATQDDNDIDYDKLVSNYDSLMQAYRQTVVDRETQNTRIITLTAENTMLKQQLTNLATRNEQLLTEAAVLRIQRDTNTTTAPVAPAPEPPQIYRASGSTETELHRRLRGRPRSRSRTCDRRDHSRDRRDRHSRDRRDHSRDRRDHSRDRRERKSFVVRPSRMRHVIRRGDLCARYISGVVVRVRDYEEHTPVCILIRDRRIRCNHKCHYKLCNCKKVGKVFMTTRVLRRLRSDLDSIVPQNETDGIFSITIGIDRDGETCITTRLSNGNSTRTYAICSYTNDE